MNRDRAPLADILERIELAIEFTGKDKKRFAESALHQDAVIRQLEVIGEASKRVSSDTRSKTDEIPWRAMIGFKNVAMHQYEAVDIERVWEIVHGDLPKIRTKIKSTLKSLSDD